jgi:phage/plasmid-associated DNA primase
MSLNPKSAKALNPDPKKNNNDLFALSDLQYCRLITMADPKDCNIFKRQEIFNITGGDYTAIRSAHRNPITAKLQAKVLIISNHPPVFNPERSEEHSRIIHLIADKENIKKVKAKIADINQAQLGIDLKKQLNSFIIYTHQFYYKYLKKDGMLYE